MKLLAWDTSSKSGVVVAAEWDEKLKDQRPKIVSEWMLNVDAAHSDRLLWAIDQTLQAARWTLDDVDLFGVGVGPGSFTGLRIGMTTARTLASVQGKPLVGVSSLAALTRPVADWLSASEGDLSKSILIAVTDACKGELYTLWGAAKSVKDCVVFSDGDRPGLWKRGVEEQVLEVERIPALVKKKLGTGLRWVAIGEGRKKYPEIWAKLPKNREWTPPENLGLNQVSGRVLSTLIWEAHQVGLVAQAEQVRPRYLRASDAELKLKAGLLPAGPTRKPALR